jgi:hypothetical protein
MAEPRRARTPGSGTHTAEERAKRRARVEAAKDALQRSAKLDTPAVRTARSTLKAYLRQLDEPRQPSDAQFNEMLAAPFREPWMGRQH